MNIKRKLFVLGSTLVLSLAGSVFADTLESMPTEDHFNDLGQVIAQCPFDIGSRPNGARTVLQVIENELHKWEEFDLPDGMRCMILLRPTQRVLTVSESLDLLDRSARWVEQARILDLSTTVNPDDPRLDVKPRVAPMAAPDTGFDRLAPTRPDMPAFPPSLNRPIPPHSEYEGSLLQDREGLPALIDPSVVVGTDDRVRVNSFSSTTTFPFISIGYMDLRWGSAGFRGSGAIVGPHMVLTAGHNVYDRDIPSSPWADGISFSPAQYQTATGAIVQKPQGESAACAWATNTAYTGGTGESQYDYAAVFFGQSFSTLGISTYMPMVFDAAPSVINTAGYPGEAHGSRTYDMWFSKDDANVSVQGRVLRYHADTSGGHSGSPVWQLRDGRRGIVAVHVAGASAAGAGLYNLGSRLVSQNKALIESWLASGASKCPLGALQVKIEPKGAVDAGAEWKRVDSTTWLKSGATETNVPAGDHLVEFATVPGWITPATRAVKVNAGQTNVLTVNYTGKCDNVQVAGRDTPETRLVDMVEKKGEFVFEYETYQYKDQIRVKYQGSTLFDTGCVGTNGWKRESLKYSGSSSIIEVQVIPNCAGTTGTAWRFVVNCPTPVKESGGLRVTIKPDAAVAAGAQWRRVGTSVWRDSGFTESDLAIGDHAVEFKTVGGWIKPVNVFVKIQPDQVFNLTRTYIWADPIKPPPATGIGDSVGLYVPLAGVYHLRASLRPGSSVSSLRFGPAPSSLLPVTGDWNGDGQTTLGLYNRASGVFNLRQGLGASAAVTSLQFGPAKTTWWPVAGDWNGDGRASVGLYNPQAGVFHLRQGLGAGASVTSLRFGPAPSTLLPVAGDWNGDGRWSVGLYSRESGMFHLRMRVGDPAVTRLAFGPAKTSWWPVPGDWNGDGRASVGLYNPQAGVFHLRQGLGAGAPVTSLRFGAAPTNWLPVSGKWRLATGTSVASGEAVAQSTPSTRVAAEAVPGEGMVAQALSGAALPAGLRERLTAARAVAWDVHAADAGEWVVFATAERLVAEDTNGVMDVYGYDVGDDRVRLLSRGWDGGAGDGPSWGPHPDGAGTRVAFVSTATNLVASDANGVADVFVHDPAIGLTERVSESSFGEAADGASHGARLSADGAWVVFVSAARNLVPGDDHGEAEVFARELASGLTQRVSRDGAGPEGAAAHPSPAHPPLRVVYERADVHGVARIHLYEETRGESRLVSQEDAAASHTHAVLSADGRYLAYLEHGAAQAEPVAVWVQERESGARARLAWPGLDATEPRIELEADGRTLRLWDAAAPLPGVREVANPLLPPRP